MYSNSLKRLSESTRTRDLALLLAAGIMALCFIWLRFPGEMNPDSQSQYSQAITGVYNDWHPPIMARLWSVFNLVISRTWTMFVFHGLCYWISLCLCSISLSRDERPRLAWALLAVGLFPPFLMLSVNIHKDIGLGVVLLLGFSVVFFARMQVRELPLKAKAISSVLLFYALLVRVNGIFGVLPIFCYVWSPKILSTPTKMLALIAVLLLPWFATENLINNKILQARPAGAVRSLQVFDLAGIAYFSRDIGVVDNVTNDLNIVDDCYNVLLADTLYSGARCGFFWDRLAVKSSPDAQTVNAELTKFWVKMILLHPFAYMEHRLSHFNSEIAFAVPSHHADLSVIHSIVNNKSNDRQIQRSSVFSKSKILDLARNNVFSTPVFWLTTSICLMIVLTPLRVSNHFELDRSSLALATSSVFYILAYLFIGVATDPRYQFPAMLAAFVGAMLAVPLIHQRFQNPRTRDIICAVVISLIVILVISFRLVLPDPIMVGN